MPFLTDIVHMTEKPMYLLYNMIIILEIWHIMSIILLCDSFKHFGWKMLAYSAKHYQFVYNYKPIITKASKTLSIILIKTSLCVSPRRSRNNREAFNILFLPMLLHLLYRIHINNIYCITETKSLQAIQA